MLTHQGEFLVTGLQRQVLIEGLQTCIDLMLPLKLTSTLSMQASQGLCLSIHYYLFSLK